MFEACVHATIYLPRRRWYVFGCSDIYNIHLEFSEATLDGTSTDYFGNLIFCFVVMPRRRTKEKKPPVKGDEIRFIRGTYKGCTGWMDTANKLKSKSKMVWVVVDDEDEEVHSRVWRTSIRESFQAPATWAEAVVQQHPDIESAVIEVARLFASCSIEDEMSVLKLVGEEIRRAMTENGKKTIRVVTFRKKRD